MNFLRSAVVVAATIAMTAPAFAYVGPGAGLSLLGALWALLAALGMAVAFVVAWPIRKALRSRQARVRIDEPPQDDGVIRDSERQPHRG